MQWRVAVNLLSFLFICVLPIALTLDQNEPKSDVEGKLTDVQSARTWPKRWLRRCRRGELKFCPDTPGYRPGPFDSGPWTHIIVPPKDPLGPIPEVLPESWGGQSPPNVFIEGIHIPRSPESPSITPL